MKEHWKEFGIFYLVFVPLVIAMSSAMFGAGQRLIDRDEERAQAIGLTLEQYQVCRSNTLKAHRLNCFKYYEGKNTLKHNGAKHD